MLTGLKLRMSAAHDTISPIRSVLLKLSSLPLFFILPTTMSPLVKFAASQRTVHSFPNFKQSRPVQMILIILIAATVAWAVITFTSQRKSRIIHASVDIQEKLTTKPFLQRHDSAMSPNGLESYHNNYLNSLKEEILQQTEKPIYPWITPPQTLPGPYDPMYYPLPAPSHQYEPVGSHPANLEGRHSTSYTYLVPKAGVPQSGVVLYGTLTTSTNGWRRLHWNVNGG